MCDETLIMQFFLHDEKLKTKTWNEKSFQDETKIIFHHF